MTPVTYVRIARSALRHNIRQVLARLQGRAKLMAVVKANAYGHGLVEAARVFVQEGAQWLGVCSVDEGVALREAGLEVPVAVFLPPAEEECEALLEARLTATATQPEHLALLAATAKRLDTVGDWQLLHSTGVGRSGWLPGTELPRPQQWPHLRCVGSFAHLDRSDYRGLRNPNVVLPPAARLGELAHIAASGAFGESLVSEAAEALWLDMVRIGTLLYGEHPSEAATRLDLEPTFEFRTRIVELRPLRRRTRVGYGREFVCPPGTRLATLPVGLRHGVGMLPDSVAGRLVHAFRRTMNVWAGRLGEMCWPVLCEVEGRQAPLVGRVSLDQCNLDVSDVPDAHVGSEVIVPARMTTTPADVPRLYVD